MTLEQIYEEIHAIRHEVQTLHAELSRYKGFVGGVLWVVTAMAGAVGYLFSFIHSNA